MFKLFKKQAQTQLAKETVLKNIKVTVFVDKLHILDFKSAVLSYCLNFDILFENRLKKCITL